jgi:hypothetical protein
MHIVVPNHCAYVMSVYKMPGAKVGDGTSLLEEIDQISLIKVSYLETETIHNLTN